MIAEGNASWPISHYGYIMFYQTTMPSCSQAATLLDWLYWTQTNPTAIQIAKRYVVLISYYYDDMGKAISTDDIPIRNGVAAASQAPGVKTQLLYFIANVTCHGAPASSLYRCIYKGTLCSDRGM